MDLKALLRGSEFWRTLPKKSLFAALAAVFFLFASSGFILDSRNTNASTSWILSLDIFTRGCLGVAWAFFGIRRMIKSMIALAVAQVGVLWWLHLLHRQLPELPGGLALHSILQRDAIGAIALVVAGYALSLAFFQWEGRRYFAEYSEAQLAGRIHRALVPIIHCRIDNFEIYGASVPSGQVGGDLVDVVEVDHGWLGYVADVSGHGVPSGVLMTMTKSAARMKLACGGDSNQLLDELNHVLKPMTTPNMFITFAYVNWMGGPELRFGLAGHLPLLHFQKLAGIVEELFVSNLPLCILPDQHFISAPVQIEAGDIVAIVTDGFTEICDSGDEEFGLEPIKRTLIDRHESSLEQISDDIRGRALAYGKQIDDQTVLLVRRLR